LESWVLTVSLASKFRGVSSIRFDKILRFLFFIIFFSLFAIGFIAPLAQTYWGYPAGEKFYTLLSPICHQYPTRCLWVFGQPTALCARCEFGYLGVAIAALFLKIKSPYWKRLLLGAFILGIAIIDPVLQLLKFYESTNIARTITGIIGGAAVFLIIYPITYRSPLCED